MVQIDSLYLPRFVIARLAVLLLVGLASGCATRQPPRLAADPGVYEIRDTTEYENVLSGGEYALLLRDGVVLDSVDLYFGVHRLNNGSVVFLPVEPSPSEEVPDGMEVAEHVVFDGRRRVRLNTFLPHFSDYFSSPNVVEGILYYWGLERLPTGEYRVYAQRYDAAARRINACFLVQAEVATDNRGHFAPPTSEGGGVRFQSFEHDFLVDPALPAGDCVVQGQGA